MDELRMFVVSLPFEVLFSSTGRADRAEDTAPEVLCGMLRAATINTTIADPKDLFGKWCASVSSACTCCICTTH